MLWHLLSTLAGYSLLPTQSWWSAEFLLFRLQMTFSSKKKNFPKTTVLLRRLSQLLKPLDSLTGTNSTRYLHEQYFLNHQNAGRDVVMVLQNNKGQFYSCAKSYKTLHSQFCKLLMYINNLINYSMHSFLCFTLKGEL